jgi:nucleotide-binding universal stress UspA family protein
MREKIYDQHGIEIFQEDSRFFVRYDAGAHMVVPRLDEISKDEADLAMTGTAAAEQVLLSLQKRLQAAGIDPYKTNV